MLWEASDRVWGKRLKALLPILVSALERNDDYILGARERTVREIHESVITDDGVPVHLIIPRQKGETELTVKDVTIGGRRYVVCRNAQEAQKDADARAQILASLEAALAQGDMKLVANARYRRYLKKAQGRAGAFAIDPAKVEADAQFDGLFVLRVHTPLTTLQAVLRYRNLLAVEDTFRAGKALLRTEQTASTPACAAPRGPRSTSSAAPSASPRHSSTRSCCPAPAP